MADFVFDGKNQKIPGVYARQTVVSNVAGIPPAFNIACIIGKGDQGQPYDVTSPSPVHFHQYQNEVNDEYGADSDIAKAFKYFKKHGGQKAYVINASDATKGTGILQDDEATPNNVIDLEAANWGDYSKDIGIAVSNATSTVVITITDPIDSGIRIVSPALTTLDACVAWINNNVSQYFKATKSSGGTNLPATFTGPKFSDTVTYAAGTNPDPTSTEYDTIIANFPEYIKELGIRLICPVINLAGASQHSVIQSFRDLALSQRAAGSPVQIFAGGILADIDITAGDVTDPTYRAGIYNNQDVFLAAPGMDSLGAFITSAPAVMGLVNNNAIAHNLTRDTINASSLEKKYTNTQLETLIDKGVCVFSYNKNGFFVAKGVNTLQANSSNWNMGNKTTYLPMQRAIADYIQNYFQEDLDNTFIGTDGVTKNQVAARCSRNWDFLMQNFDPSLFSSEAVLENGLPYNTDDIRATTEGWYVDIGFIPANETNYIGLTVQVNVSL